MNALIDVLKRVIRPRFRKSVPMRIPESATVISRKDHNVSRKQVSPNALKVLYKLRKAGFGSFLVGGCVRDMLLGHEPKDFDVATDAKPEQVKKLFKNCRLIGKRFRLAHVYFKGEIIEVATFRAGPDTYQDGSRSIHGLLIRDNVYGELEDDVWRRDFTINALYYNIADFSLLDFMDGAQDLKQGIIKIIGDPHERYKEDPVRMLRAIRFAAKLGFRLEANTAQAISTHATLLEHVSNARIFDECLKLFLTGHAADTFSLLRQHQLFDKLFPLVEELLSDVELHQVTHQLIEAALIGSDQRVAEGKSVTAAFFFAALLWMPLQKKNAEFITQGYGPHLAFDKAAHHTLNVQTQKTAITKACSNIVREIWSMQYYLERPAGKRPLRLIQQARFRAAYDFLLLRACIQPELKDVGDWWTEFYHAGENKRHHLLDLLKAKQASHGK